ncbi:regulatory protein RecX [bacterium]|nr:regulatory protein RecX [bacterium]
MKKFDPLLYSYRLLSLKSYSEKQLFDKLKGKGCSIEEINSIIDRLKELKYLNDDDYLIEFIKSEIRKKEGPKLIKQKLQQRGVSVDILDEKLDELYSQESQVEAIKYWISKKLDKIAKKSVDSDNEEDLLDEIEANRSTNSIINKVVSFCLRKGFSYSDVSIALSEYKDTTLDLSKTT